MKRIIWGIWIVMFMTVVADAQDFVLSNPTLSEGPVKYPGGRQNVSFDFYVAQGNFKFSSNPADQNHATIAFTFTKMDPSAIVPQGDGAALFNWSLLDNGAVGADKIYTWLGSTKDLLMQQSPGHRKYKIVFTGVPVTMSSTVYESDLKVVGAFTNPQSVPSYSITANNTASISTYTVAANCVAGLDFGDLPVKWPQPSARVTSGDCNNDGVPDGPDVAVWAGAGVTYEPSQKFSDHADADGFDDGLGFPASILLGKQNNYTVTLSTNTPGARAYYGLWFDWNNDGNFANDFAGSGQGLPGFFSGSAEALPNGTIVNVPVIVPAKLGANYKVRLIVSSTPVSKTGFAGKYDNGEIEDYEVNGRLLPVEITNLETEVNGCDIAMNWKVAAAYNIASYELELGRDATRFTSVAKIPAIDTVDEYRQVISVDKSMKSPVVSVRVKAVDLEGKVVYSRISTVSGVCNNAAPLIVTMFPNPVIDTRRVTFSAKEGQFNGKYGIVLTDFGGKRIQSKELELNKLKSFNYDLPDALAGGSYRFYIISQDKSQSVIVDFIKL